MGFFRQRKYTAEDEEQMSHSDWKNWEHDEYEAGYQRGGPVDSSQSIHYCRGQMARMEDEE